MYNAFIYQMYLENVQNVRKQKCVVINTTYCVLVPCACVCVLFCVCVCVCVCYSELLNK